MVDPDALVPPPTANGWQPQPRLLVLVPENRTPPPGLTRAAADLGCDMVVRSHGEASRLSDGAVDAASLVWAILEDGLDPPLADALRDALETEGLPLVLHVTDQALDAAWAVFGASDDVSFVAGDDAGDATFALAQALAAREPAMASAVWDNSRDRQIDRLQEEVQRIAAMLARLSASGGDFAPGQPPSPFIDDHVASPGRDYRPHPAGTSLAGAAATRVRRMIRDRRARELVFAPELFADPAWDMLLDLYAARLERRPVSVSSLCIAAAVPATTALRWIRMMTESGLFVRTEDVHDGRRIFVELSNDAAASMAQYFDRLDSL